MCRYSSPRVLLGLCAGGRSDWRLLVHLSEVGVAPACLWSPLWQQWLMPTPGVYVDSALLPESVCRERSSYGGLASLLMHPPSVAPCLSGGPRHLPRTPSGAILQPLRAVSSLLTAILSPGLISEARASAPSPCSHWWTSISGRGVQGGSTDHLCKLLNLLPSADQLLHSPSRLWSFLSIQANFPTSDGTSQGVGTFLSQLPPWGSGPVLIPFSLSLFFFFIFYFSFVLPGYVEIFLPFWKSEVCQHSVDVLCKSFHL